MPPSQYRAGRHREVHSGCVQEAFPRTGSRPLKTLPASVGERANDSPRFGAVDAHSCYVVTPTVKLTCPAALVTRSDLVAGSSFRQTWRRPKDH